MSGSIPPLGRPNGLNEVNPIPRKRTARDYQFGNKIGEGSYSTVFLAVDLYNNKTYAIKVLSKKHIVKEDKIKYVNIEKTTLHRLGQQHPGIVQLYYTFQDDQSLFFVLDFAEYGELLTIISKFGSLLESVLKFYMLQIIDAVRFIHLKGVIHRDLKPENILVDYNFKLKITDFGAAKLLGTDDDSQDEKINFDSIDNQSSRQVTDRKGSFVGTAEYVPPELLKFNECGFETDIWAIGCILFQFFNGAPPFKESTEYLTFEKIINVSYSYRSPIPPLVKDVIDLILVFDPEKRLTIPQIQSMQWFAGIPWNDREFIWNRKVPRFEPFVSLPYAQKFTAPQLKTGSNRNVSKSNSNYQLHNQIQQFDYNLVPAIGAKKLFQPPTRIKKVVSSGPLPSGGQQNFPPSRFDAVGHNPDRNFVPPSAQKPLNNSWKPTHAGINPQKNKGNTPVQQYGGSSNVSQISPTNRSRSPAPPNASETASQNAARIAQQSLVSVPVLEKQLSSVQVSAPKSPQMRNLRQNTAFAKSTNQVKSSPNTAPPSSKPPQLNAASAAANAVTRKSSLRSATPKKEHRIQSSPSPPLHAVLFEEILSFLKPKEKIIKLDTILKLILSNKLIDRTPGNLDIDVIESLIKRHGSILQSNMVPVVACISNLARVFLIDNRLDVMMVDLTANRGGDYLIYDYDFESIVVGDNESEEAKKQEVYGYLILELIKEGGDLVLLKRFEDVDRIRFKNPTRVLGKSGEHVVLGKDYGWIDCLVYAKELVDKLTQEQQPKQQKPHNTATKQTTKQVPMKKTTRTSAGPGNKKKPVSPETPKNTNNFAYAAAAAAHR